MYVPPVSWTWIVFVVGTQLDCWTESTAPSSLTSPCA